MLGDIFKSDTVFPPGPGQACLLEILKLVFGLDWGEKVLYGADQKKRRAIALLNGIVLVCRSCFFDRRSGKWLYYVKTTVAASELDIEAAVDYIAAPIMKFLLGRR